MLKEQNTTLLKSSRWWENGYNESFNGKLRDELLNGEIFYTLRASQVLIEEWRKTYNQIRPHSSLDYRSPAPAATPVPGKLHPDAWLRPQNLRPVLT
jgi:putative transposase